MASTAKSIAEIYDAFPSGPAIRDFIYNMTSTEQATVESILADLRTQLLAATAAPLTMTNWITLYTTRIRTIVQRVLTDKGYTVAFPVLTNNMTISW